MRGETTTHNSRSTLYYNKALLQKGVKMSHATKNGKS